MKILWKYLSPHKNLVFLSLLLAAAAQLLTLVDPVIFGKIIDEYATNKNNLPENELMQGITKWLALAFGIAILARLSKAAQDYITRKAVAAFGMNIFNDGLKQTLRLSYQEFEESRSGTTLSVLQKVKTDAERFINSFINVLYASLIGVGFLLWYSINKNWLLVPVFFVGVVLLGSLTGLVSKKIKGIQKSINRQTDRQAGVITESLRNIELVKSLGLTFAEIRRLNEQTARIYKLEMLKARKVSFLSFLQGNMLNLLKQSILFILLWLIFRKVLSTGELIAMQFISTAIFTPLQELGNMIILYREADASLRSFDALMKRPIEQRPENSVEVGKLESLRFENVVFRHKTAGYNAIDGISFDIRLGETIAFVGPSGSGKSTLVKLLVGLYVPNAGAIYFNEINSGQIRYNPLRRQIGFVTQDTQLYAGTIKDNLLFVNPAATDDEIKMALKKAAATALVAKASNGLNTVLGESGMKLSGGEKQRLSIARALLRQPPLLIFDEATSALDSLTEEEITGTIKNISLERKQMTILIAHRLSTIMHADTIYVLEKGKISETGSHEDLLVRKGLYYSMWRQQVGERR
ncbi:ABC transporter ATP-binding protein [Flavobacterium noncentrifugens]|uniref:ATP-binding cassette, subfamily B n=1 Tax=Flavobacterium noncentrifugens TaxID=1128970 RepID=A0A1G8YBQ2_9FLAO|nr:ABC transporter ATP-binding protein [Flavobacterium noncentrifugens]GEP51160.1 ABC transporter ATP-binding protein [Flavobacterium noncentrifugens]SDK00126.1 ATP-binding cassette, subfamily B [Flavobacterium noncentrifugens]